VPAALPLIALCDAVIFTGEAMVEGHALLIQDDKIADITRKPPANAQKKSFPDRILAPGFIDAQINGGGNILLNNTPTAEACVAIAAAHRKFGTTHLLPTCITDTPEVTQKAVAAVREARKSNKAILGIHIEGPHLNVDARGVHSAEHIRAISDEDLQLYRREDGEVMLMTVAPENVSPQQIKKLREQGIAVSLGHTKAAPEQIRAALAAGASGFTHLYNGMGGATSHVVHTALEDRASWCSLIADGHHVSADRVRAALRAKPGKIFLVSDAMAPAATDKPQPFRLYGETIQIDQGRCANTEGRLAGSMITMLDAVRYCVKTVDIEIEEALRMASAYPAAFLGLDKKLGQLLPGFESDVIAFTPDLKDIRAMTFH